MSTTTASSSSASSSSASSSPAVDTPLLIYASAELLLAAEISLSNFVVIFVYLRSKHIRTPTNAYIFSLALTDFLTGTFGIPFTVASVLTRWPGSFYACLAIHLILCVLCTVSTLHLLAMAFDKYLTICMKRFVQQRNSSTTSARKTRAHFLIVGCWLTGTAIAGLPMVDGFGFAQRTFANFRGECHFTVVVDYRYLVYVIFFGTIILPSLVIAFCYVSIYKRIRNEERQIKCLLRASERQRRISVRRKLIRTLLILVLTYAGCWYPLYVINTLDLFLPARFHAGRSLTLFAVVLSHVNCALNPLIYAYGMPGFKHSLRRFLPIKEDKNSVTQHQHHHHVAKNAAASHYQQIHHANNNNNLHQNIHHPHHNTHLLLHKNVIAQSFAGIPPLKSPFVAPTATTMGTKRKATFALKTVVQNNSKNIENSCSISTGNWQAAENNEKTVVESNGKLSANNFFKTRAAANALNELAGGPVKIGTQQNVVVSKSLLEMRREKFRHRGSGFAAVSSSSLEAENDAAANAMPIQSTVETTEENVDFLLPFNDFQTATSQERIEKERDANYENQQNLLVPGAESGGLASKSSLESNFSGGGPFSVEEEEEEAEEEGEDEEEESSSSSICDDEIIIKQKLSKSSHPDGTQRHQRRTAAAEKHGKKESIVSKMSAFSVRIFNGHWLVRNANTGSAAKRSIVSSQEQRNGLGKGKRRQKRGEGGGGTSRISSTSMMMVIDPVEIRDGGRGGEKEEGEEKEEDENYKMKEGIRDEEEKYEEDEVEEEE